MKLFAVGKYINKTEDGIIWTLEGIYDDEERAIKRCTDHTYFVGPLELNKDFPIETIEWPGGYYPIEK